MLTHIEKQIVGNNENDVLETINNVMNIVTLMSTCAIPVECSMDENTTVTLDTRRQAFDFLKKTFKENLNVLAEKGFKIPDDLQDYLSNLTLSSKPLEEGAEDPFLVLQSKFMEIFN